MEAFQRLAAAVGLGPLATKAVNWPDGISASFVGESHPRSINESIISTHSPILVSPSRLKRPITVVARAPAPLGNTDRSLWRLTEEA